MKTRKNVWDLLYNAVLLLLEHLNCVATVTLPHYPEVYSHGLALGLNHVTFRSESCYM